MENNQNTACEKTQTPGPVPEVVKRLQHLIQELTCSTELDGFRTQLVAIVDLLEPARTTKDGWVIVPRSDLRPGCNNGVVLEAALERLRRDVTPEWPNDHLALIWTGTLSWLRGDVTRAGEGSRRTCAAHGEYISQCPACSSPTQPEEPDPGFDKSLERLLNRYSQENRSNTPDFILATYLLACLAAYNMAVARRADWYGHMDSPGQSAPLPPAALNESSPLYRAFVPEPAPAERHLPPRSRWNPAEAIYAFMSWLTTRDEELTLGARQFSGAVVPLIEAFRARQGLAPVREGWERCIVPEANGERLLAPVRDESIGLSPLEAHARMVGGHPA